MSVVPPWVRGRPGGPSQRGPAVVDPLLLDPPDLRLADAKLLRDELARLGDRRAAVLGLDQGQEDFLAARLRERLLRLVHHGRLLGKAPAIVVAGARAAFFPAGCPRPRPVIE